MSLRTGLDEVPLLAAAGQPPVLSLTEARTRRTRAAEARIDWSQVRALREAAAKNLADTLRQRTGGGPQEEREIGRRIVGDLLLNHAQEMASAGEGGPGRPHLAALEKAVMDSLFGMGRLQPLVDDPQLENIMIRGCDNVELQYADGRRERGAPVADSDEELIDTLSFIAARSQANERPFSPAHPSLDLRLDGGPRLSASAWITPRPVAVIRLHRLRDATLASLTERGMFLPQVHDFLSRAIRANKSIVVAGPMGAGKTTLVRALAHEFHPWEAIGTIETEYELQLNELPGVGERVIAWETRPGTGEIAADGSQVGEVTINGLLYRSWRYNLNRIIVGEVRGVEVMAMLNAMGGGAGSLCTVHAKNARAAVSRLATLATMYGENLTPEVALRQVVQNIDLVVQLAVQVDEVTGRRHRYISEILLLRDEGEERPAMITLWLAEPGQRVARQSHMPFDLAADLGLRP